MFKFFTAALVVFLLTTSAQAQHDIQWEKSLGGTNNDVAYSISPSADGGYFAAGYSFSTDSDVTGNHGNSDCWVVKLTAAGTIQWQKSLGGPGNDIGHSIAATADGGCIVAGQNGGNGGDVTGNHGGVDYWVVKLDTTGTIQWQKSYGGTANDLAECIAPTVDGGYIVAGISLSNNGDVTGHHGPVDDDYWIVKLDASGTMQWQKSLGGTSNDDAYSIAQTADRGYIVTGSSGSINGDVTGHHGFNNYDYWVVKLDTIGAIQWQKSLGGSYADEAYSIAPTADGGYIVAGYSASTDGDVTGHYSVDDYWVVKLGATGSIQWQKSLGGTNFDEANSVVQTADRGYIVAGNTASTDGDLTGHYGNTGPWIVKLDTTGTIQWQKSLGDTANDQALSIAPTLDGGYVVAGYSSSITGGASGYQGSLDYWVVKLGCIATTSTDTQTACGSYTWRDGHTYTASTHTATDTIAGGSVSGSDSIITLWLTIIDPGRSTDTQTACGSYTWRDGHTYTASTHTATDTIAGGSVSGCDSIITLSLTIDSMMAPVITDSSGVLSTGSYSSYTWYLDGTVMVGDTSRLLAATQNGSYTVAVTSADGCSATSAAYIVAGVGIAITPGRSDLLLYPNPASYQFTVVVPGQSGQATIQIEDILGQTIRKMETVGESGKVDVHDLATGVYIVHISTATYHRNIRLEVVR
ncbi:MAG: T9SS type A sorting domain-containing protein [Bacteroidetes bacterium]|nr:T9SS type A sorting domain-containing protein [Bacteroidota bacterium]